MKLNVNFETLERLFSSTKKFILRTIDGQMTDEYEKSTFDLDGFLRDVETKHNNSWYRELYNRNQKRLDAIALSYRGTETTYKEMFEHMMEYAKALKKMGCKKGMEVPVCLSNTPELVYILGAVSMIGCKVNIFSDHYPNDYITEIINGCDSPVMFVEDNSYLKIKEGIESSSCSNVVCISLRNSLHNDFDPYASIDDNTGKFNNHVMEIINSEHKKAIHTVADFISQGADYSDMVEESVDLDTPFAITYTSGSTNALKPKAIVHNVRSFNTVARFHDVEYNGGFDMSKYNVLSLIPSYSNSNIISCISDSLMQGSKLSLEPIYDMDFFITSLLINKPNYVAATRSFWVDFAKKVLCSKKFKNIKLPSLFLCFSAGEHLDKNEEKLINKAFSKVHAGKSITHTPVSVIKISEAGGDCEHGSIFYTLFRALSNIKPQNLLRDEPAGMQPLPFVDVAVLDKEGRPLPPYKLGRLVANSPCTMREYKNNPEATKGFFITDANGKVWGDLNVYAYLDKKKNVYMRGRIPKSEEFLPPFLVAKEVLRDTKNILSCEVVYDENFGYVAHVELQPFKRHSAPRVLYGAMQRVLKMYPVLNEIGFSFRLRSFKESFPLTGSGKRDSKALKAEGIEKCVYPVIDGDDYKLVSVTEDMDAKKDHK